jgi:hypothetical protein
MGGTTDEFFEATGPGNAGGAGFLTSVTAFSTGGDFTGNQIGVKATCQGPIGDGVQGFGSGSSNGVAGFGGPENGTGVVGRGAGASGPGVRGHGAPGVAGFGADQDSTNPNAGTGVFGVGGGSKELLSNQQGAPGVKGFGGLKSPGVFAQAGQGNADGVEAHGSGSFSGVAGFGGPDNGTGVFGVGAGASGPGVKGIGTRVDGGNGEGVQRLW